MSELRVKKRRRLREKEIKVLVESFRDILDIEMFGAKDTIDLAESMEIEVIFVNNVIEGMIVDGAPFLTVRGLLKHRPTRRFVTVDMGAVPFVTKGADVMSPGIVEADPGIHANDMVWIRDVKHSQPLAIGKALIGAEEMVQGKQGKAILTIHYVGDKIWKYDER